VTLIKRSLHWLCRQRRQSAWSRCGRCVFFHAAGGLYVLRPLRDQMGIAGGVKALPWMFTATFVSLLVVQPIYGALVKQLPRRWFIAIVYQFFRGEPWRFLAAADAERVDRHRGACFFRLGQRLSISLPSRCSGH